MNANSNLLLCAAVANAMLRQMRCHRSGKAHAFSDACPGTLLLDWSGCIKACSPESTSNAWEKVQTRIA
eukprot:1158375-Pelagomonas_calceolata.AAC.8